MATRRRGSVTIRDVARESGVSIATVTRTFQDSPLVREATRERVLLAADALGYRPDQIARALATGSTHTIGVLLPSLVEAYWGEIADGIEQRAGEQGFSVIFGRSRGEPEHEQAMLDLFLGKRLDGIIVAGVAGEPRRRAPASDASPPLVQLEWDATPQPELLRSLGEDPITEDAWQIAEQRLAGDWFAHISYDDVAGGGLVAAHLLGLGHTRIAFVAGSPVRTCLLRLLGLRSSIEAAGVRLERTVLAGDSFEEARAAVSETLRQPDRPGALVCYNDVIAISAIRAAHDLGLDVPGDVSIVGFDDIEMASWIEPALTTLKHPKRRVGELAVELLERGRRGEPGPVHRRLTGSLVRRDSAGPPQS